MTDMNAEALASINMKLRIATRALGNAGLAHAFGHCSVRLDGEHFLVCAPQPLKTVLASEDGVVVPTTGALPAGVLGEVLIHQNLYRLRPEVGAVCRIMPPHTMTLSTQRITPRVRHGLGAYFANNIPLLDDPRLLRSPEAALKLVEHMGQNPALVMRGNGAVVVGESLEQAISFSWFLEDSARVEVDIRKMGFDPGTGLLDEQEVIDRQVVTGQVFERMWRFLTHGDPELSGQSNNG
jgi:HCOMODA/2-hydroxy-3-carboxy-muconic semialdehyde decarboxylase